MIIEVKKLVKRYGDLIALDHFNLEVKEGSIHGLLGPNGSGKSTAINCILSLLKYEKGSIKIFGKEMTPASYDLKKEIGLVPQEIALMEELSVEDNVDFFCGLYIENKKERKNLVEEAIQFVELNDFRRKTIKTLSGGLKRRANIACGIAHRPKILILDEPTVAVDPQSRNNILEGIKKLREKGVTVIYTTHYMEEVEMICDNISIIDGGKNIITGTKEELKESINLGDKIKFESINIAKKEIEELKNMDYVKDLLSSDGDLTLILKKESKVINILQILDKKEISYGRVIVESPTLNDVFLEITGKELRDNV